MQSDNVAQIHPVEPAEKKHAHVVRERALVEAAEAVLWAFREPVKQGLPVFPIATLLLLEEALGRYGRRLP
ncbi:MAG TPA: hypothetical protein VGD10_00800 [Allosphingosinicella sp.]|uniref:hypothetical protein n=1 Tax=Allosphingosinicella sp. TaxID=2823234 RepID=UPI002ED86EBF